MGNSPSITNDAPRIQLNWASRWGIPDDMYNVPSGIGIEDARNFITDNRTYDYYTTSYVETSREATSWADHSRHGCCNDETVVDNLRRILNGNNRVRNDGVCYPSLRQANSMFDAIINRINDRNSQITKEYNSAYQNNLNHRIYLEQTLPATRKKNIANINAYISQLNKMISDTEALIIESNINIENIKVAPTIADPLEKTSANQATTVRPELSLLKTMHFGNLSELYGAITMQNDILDNEKSSISKNNTTNSREADFLGDKNSYISKINTYLFYGYYLFFLVYLYVLFAVQKDISIVLKIVYIILLGGLPFYISALEIYILDTWKYIYAFMSGTVYTPTIKTVKTAATST
jgi:hypothetical protein